MLKTKRTEAIVRLNSCVDASLAPRATKFEPGQQRRNRYHSTPRQRLYRTRSSIVFFCSPEIVWICKHDTAVEASLAMALPSWLQSKSAGLACKIVNLSCSS